ncbi:MAG: glycosyltransferase family 2 protein [Armatimonadetes bacterium]|nr:glycosyltransferase family 2 protein [Armatimonadota bacterium]
MGLTAALVCKNEEKNMERVLRSVQFADQILVVDSGSTDKTLEIARRFTGDVIVRDWPGFSAQKNFALSQASEEWVLCMDADEEVSPELALEIQEVVAGRRTGFRFYNMPRLTRFVDRWMRHGGWYPDRQLRLLQNGAGEYNDHPVHAAITPDEPVGKLQGDILHYSFESISDYVDRMNGYSSTMARMLLERTHPPRVGPFGLGLTLARKFLEVYLLKRGFLDGGDGFVVACLGAYSVFLRQAKVWRPEK